MRRPRALVPAVAAVLAAVAALVVAEPRTARADTVKEPSTGQPFDTERAVAGHPYALLGTGVRKKFIVKVYAMALYVEQEGARRAFPSLVARAGSRERARLLAHDHAQEFVMWGRFGKLAVLRFVRDVDGAKIREAFSDGLSGELAGKAGPDVQRDAQALIALFDHDLKEGQEIVIASDDAGHLGVDLAGAHHDGPTDAKLARALWAIWLGTHSISSDLRKSLVENVDSLGK